MKDLFIQRMSWVNDEFKKQCNSKMSKTQKVKLKKKLWKESAKKIK